MSKKTQQEIVKFYLLHRECVRRNPRYARAYRKVHAIKDPTRHVLETVVLAEQWGLSHSDILPNPVERLGYDPDRLLQDAGLSRETFLAGIMKTDPLEIDAAVLALEHLSTSLYKLARELKGFLVLLHLPEEPNPPWGLDVIDLRRPKEEILEDVQDLVDEVRKSRRQSLHKTKRLPMWGPLTKGFDYLKVYDLRKQKKRTTFKDIANEMWNEDPDAPADTEGKASDYFSRADAMVTHPPFLRMLAEQLTRRRNGRALDQADGAPVLPSVWGKRVWLKPAPLSPRRSH